MDRELPRLNRLTVTGGDYDHIGERKLTKIGHYIDALSEVLNLPQD